MVRVLERPEVRPAPEGDTLVREIPEQVEAPEAPPIHRVPDRDVVLAPSPKRPIRWMRWLGGFVVVLIGAGLVVYAATGDGTERAGSVVPRSADGAEGWLLSVQPETVAVPRSADGAERWIDSLEPVVPAQPGVPYSADGVASWIGSERLAPVAPLGEFAVPRSADGAEAWIDATADVVLAQPVGPRTADGAERWIEMSVFVMPEQPGVPYSADGAEGWIESVNPFR